MLSSENRQPSEWDDFLNGNTIEFDELTEGAVENFVKILCGGDFSPYDNPYDKLFAEFKDDFDQLARVACCAFKNELITREQVGNLLELRTIKMNPSFSLEITALLDKQNQFTPKAEKLLPHFLDSRQRVVFLEKLKEVPPSERYFLTLTITGKDLVNVELQGLLNVTEGYISKKSQIEPFQRYIAGTEEFQLEPDIDAVKSQTLSTFLLGAENAMIKTICGEHTKALFPVLGELSINDIERSMRKGGRYLGLSYPGIQDVSSFHNVEANVFYIALHDKAHRRLISSINNNLYQAFLHAIDVIRNLTQQKWSHEIWICIDMEVGIFLRETEETLTYTSPQDINENFCKLLNANVYTTGEPLGLFTASSFIDTTWLLLIDMVLRADEWKKFAIDPELFTGDYGLFIRLIKAYEGELKNMTSPAHQVALVKFGAHVLYPQVYKKKLECQFKKIDKYLQLTVGGEPQVGSKKKLLEIIHKLGEGSIDIIRSQLQHIRLLLKFPESVSHHLEKLPIWAIKLIVAYDKRTLNLIQEGILPLDHLENNNDMQFVYSSKDILLSLQDKTFTSQELIEIKSIITVNLDILFFLRKGKLTIDEIKGFSGETIKAFEQVTILDDFRDGTITLEEIKNLQKVEEKGGEKRASPLLTHSINKSNPIVPAPEGEIKIPTNKQPK